MHNVKSSNDALFNFLETPDQYWHDTLVEYNNDNKTDVFCEFFQYYPDKSATPVIPSVSLHLNQGKWALEVSGAYLPYLLEII